MSNKVHELNVDELIGAIRSVTGPGSVALHEPIFQGNERKYIDKCIESTYVSSVGQFVEKAPLTVPVGRLHADALNQNGLDGHPETHEDDHQRDSQPYQCGSGVAANGHHLPPRDRGIDELGHAFGVLRTGSGGEDRSGIRRWNR